MNSSVTFGAWFRKNVFWLLDSIKGSPVKKHYCDISAKMSRDYDPSLAAEEISRYAAQHVPFYQGMQGKRFDQFPVMNKEKYNERFADMRSDEFLDDNALSWARTSGSTGTPFSVPRDKNKTRRTQAELLYFHDLSNWHLGDRYFFVRAWVAYNASKMKQFKQNFRAFDTTKFDDKNKRRLLNAIQRDKKLRVVFSYSSVMTDFAEYLERNNITVPNENIKLIVVDSDTLLPGAKERIEKVFGTKLMNRYDNEEHGVLACMLPDTEYWKVNTASYYIELLKIDSDEPCEPGEVGRVVVTDLTNKAFPFIRYDVGDLASSDSYNGRYLTRIDSIEGRTKNIILNTDGNRIDNVTFSANFELFNEIRRYQLIQMAEKEYLIKIEEKTGMTLNQKDLLEKMKECLGQDAKIDIVIVDQIESTKAGKYQPVLSLYSRRLS